MDVRYLIDADVPRALYRGLKRRMAELDVVRVQHVGLTSSEDPEILQFAADDGRITISRDRSTMLDFARQRIVDGKTMPGLLLFRPGFAGKHGRGLGAVIDELILVAHCTDAGEWGDLIQFIPFLES